MIERLLTLGLVLLGLIIFQASARGQQRTIQLPLLEISENQPTSSSSSQMLSTLAMASQLDSARVGYAGTPGPYYTAYQQAKRLGAEVYPQLQQLLPTATPSGKLYLSALIRRIDPSQGKALLTELTSDQTQITGQSGCLGLPTTVSAIATEILNAEIDADLDVTGLIWN